MAALKDVLTPRPRILFVGINPGLRSWAVGHHFAGPGNPFWRLLHASELIPEPLGCEEDQRLAQFGLALVNLCPRPTRTAAELGREELARGARALVRKIRRLRPQVVALVGVTLYERIAARPTSKGPGPKMERFEGARLFVLPNPSGLNASYPGFRHKLIWFKRLRAFAEGSPAPGPRGSAGRVDARRGGG